MLWSIYSCQNKVSADQFHVTILRAEVWSSARSPTILKLTADQLLVFDWIMGSFQVNLLIRARLFGGYTSVSHYFCFV